VKEFIFSHYSTGYYEKDFFTLYTGIDLFNDGSEWPEGREPENKTGMRTGILHDVPVVNINNVTVTEEDSLATLYDKPVRCGR
jgi:hypothetical protein